MNIYYQQVPSTCAWVGQMLGVSSERGILKVYIGRTLSLWVSVRYKLLGVPVGKTDHAVQPPLLTNLIQARHGIHYFSVMSGMTVRAMERPRESLCQSR